MERAGLRFGGAEGRADAGSCAGEGLAGLYVGSEVETWATAMFG